PVATRSSRTCASQASSCAERCCNATSRAASSCGVTLTAGADGVLWLASNDRSGSNVRKASASATVAASASQTGRRVARRTGRTRAASCGQASAGGDSSVKAAKARCQLSGAGGRVSVMSLLLDLQQIAQAARAARQLRLGKAWRAAQGGTDLFVREAFGVIEPQHAARGGGKLQQRALQQRRISRFGRRRSQVFARVLGLFRHILRKLQRLAAPQPHQ